MDISTIGGNFFTVLAAVGLWDAFKKIILARVDEFNEKRQLNNNAKRKIKEDIFNFVAVGESSFYQNYPTSQDIANIYRISYQLKSFKKTQLSLEIDHYVFNWQLYLYLKDQNMQKLRNKIKDHLDDLSIKIVQKVGEL